MHIGRTTIIKSFLAAAKAANTLPRIEHTINSTLANVNLWTLTGSPTHAVEVIVTLAASRTLYSNSTAPAALLIPNNFHADSYVKLVTGSGSYITGMGGSGATVSGEFAFSGGTSGGPAIQTYRNIIIDNGGTIQGGGGGGGAQRWHHFAVVATNPAAAGGGGGAGNLGGPAGSNGSFNGTHPTAGTLTAGGVRGLSGGYAGGHGGAPGQNGEQGVIIQTGIYPGNFPQNDFGLGGAAIDLVNGATVTYASSGTIHGTVA